MEAVGLAIGVAGLATAFSTCMECFEYVQMGRSFGDDYGKCVLRLDCARLRLSRWGASIGLDSTSTSGSMITVSSEEFDIARSLLVQIGGAFEDAENLSERYRKHLVLQKSKTTDLIVNSTGKDLAVDFRNLHIKMREIAMKRQENTSIVKKTKWALYEKKRFDTMIEELTGFLDDLVELFPGAKERQESLCKAEVSSLRDSKTLTIMDEAAEGTDEILQRALKHELGFRGNVAADWKAGGTAKVRIGDTNAFGVESTGNTSRNFTVSESADVWIGNDNKGKQ